MNTFKTRGDSLSAENFFEVYGFLCKESDYLSQGDYKSWLTLIQPDIHYRIAAPSFLDAVRPRRYGLGNDYYDDDYATLKIRVQQLTTPNYSIAENPLSLLRHFVTNISGSPIESGFEVSSNVLVYRVRSTEPEPAIVAGRRKDILVRTPEGLRLSRREAQLDQVSLRQPNISFFM